VEISEYITASWPFVLSCNESIPVTAFSTTKVNNSFCCKSVYYKKSMSYNWNRKAASCSVSHKQTDT